MQNKKRDKDKERDLGGVNEYQKSVAPSDRGEQNRPEDEVSPSRARETKPERGLREHIESSTLDHARGSVTLQHLEKNIRSLLDALRQGDNEADLNEDLTVQGDSTVQGVSTVQQLKLTPGSDNEYWHITDGSRLRVKSTEDSRFINMDARTDGNSYSWHRYRDDDTGTPVAYKEDWYDGSDYYRIGVENSKFTMNSPLMIDGPLYVTNDNSGVLQLARGSGNPTIKPYGSEGWMIVDGNGSGLGLNYLDGSRVVIANGGGNVGIGTTSPNAKLEVSGEGYINGGVKSGGEIHGDQGAFFTWRYDYLLTSGSTTSSSDYKNYGAFYRNKEVDTFTHTPRIYIKGSGWYHGHGTSGW